MPKVTLPALQREERASHPILGADARYLVVGTRNCTDTYHYPDHDLITHKDGDARHCTHADGTPRSGGSTQ